MLAAASQADSGRPLVEPLTRLVADRASPLGAALSAAFKMVSPDEHALLAARDMTEPLPRRAALLDRAAAACRRE